MSNTEDRRQRAARIEDILRHFTGSESVYRHPLVRKCLYTEGVHYIADECEAYWLLDKIATLQLEPSIAAEDFQAWRLEVTDGSAVLTCTDGGKEGNNPAIVHQEQIGFTDFPLDDITIWVEFDGQHYTLLLPSEH